jgi:hypothetical protein
MFKIIQNMGERKINGIACFQKEYWPLSESQAQTNTQIAIQNYSSLALKS